MQFTQFNKMLNKYNTERLIIRLIIIEYVSHFTARNITGVQGG